MLHTFSGIKQKLDRLAVNAQKVGLKTNVGKTKLLWIGAVCLTSLMHNDIQIEDVNEFCYLKSIVAENGEVVSDVKVRVNKAWQAFHSLRKI
jgi:hypothetical protein